MDNSEKFLGKKDVDFLISNIKTFSMCNFFLFQHRIVLIKVLANNITV